MQKESAFYGRNDDTGSDLVLVTALTWKCFPVYQHNSLSAPEIIPTKGH